MEFGGLLKEIRVIANQLNAGNSGGKRVLEGLLEEGATAVPMMARKFGYSRQNVQWLVNRLEAEGLVELRENPAHQRSKLVGLTVKGRRRVKEGGDEAREFMASVEKVLSEEEVALVYPVLVRLRAALEKRKSWRAEVAIEEDEDGLPVNLL